MEYDPETKQAVLTDNEASCLGMTAGIPVSLTLEVLSVASRQTEALIERHGMELQSVAMGAMHVLRRMQDELIDAGVRQ